LLWFCSCKLLHEEERRKEIREKKMKEKKKKKRKKNVEKISNLKIFGEKNKRQFMKLV
jgi:Zn-finger protein